jgi:hypothetical protein
VYLHSRADLFLPGLSHVGCLSCTRIMAASMQRRPEGLSLGSNNITRTARSTQMHVKHTDRPRDGNVSYHIMNTEYLLPGYPSRPAAVCSVSTPASFQLQRALSQSPHSTQSIRARGEYKAGRRGLVTESWRLLSAVVCLQIYVTKHQRTAFAPSQAKAPACTTCAEWEAQQLPALHAAQHGTLSA